MSRLTAESVLAIVASLLLVVWLLILLRVITRRIEGQSHLVISDALLFLGAIDATCLFGSLIWAYKIMAMTDSPTLSKSILINTFIADYFFDVGIYLPKFSILAFYFKLIHPTSTKMRITLYLLTTYVASCCLTSFFGDTFWCVGADVAKNWDINWVMAGGCTSIYSWPWFYVLWGMNISSDLFIFIFPFPVLSTLSMPSRLEKLGVMLIFTLGIATMGVSVGRFYTYTHTDSTISLAIWCMAEIMTAVTVVVLPSLRPLLRRIKIRSFRKSSETTGNTCLNKSKSSFMVEKGPLNSQGNDIRCWRDEAQRDCERMGDDA